MPCNVPLSLSSRVFVAQESKALEAAFQAVNGSGAGGGGAALYRNSSICKILHFAPYRNATAGAAETVQSKIAILVSLDLVCVT